MSSESDLKAATARLAPHEIEEWQTSLGNAHTSVRRLSLMRGKDSNDWYADQVLAITKHLSADRGGILESLEIAQFIPDAGSTGGDPPPIGEVLRPVAHSLTSIWLDVPDVWSGTLLGILHCLPKLEVFTVYAQKIRRSYYEGDITRGRPPTTGKLGLYHLDAGGDSFINQLLQYPREYHAIGLSHNKLIDSYNALINASGDTLQSLAIHDIGKHIHLHPNPSNRCSTPNVYRGTALQTGSRSHIRRQLFRTFRTYFRCRGDIRSQDDTYDHRRPVHRLLNPLREAPDLIPIRSQL